jgi:ABC-2 type transport system ATP-binding protein
MSKFSLQLRNIHYSYPQKDTPILTGVDLDISAGRTIGVQGGNGSGKSTLLKIIASILSPSQGVILYNGVPVRGRLSEYRNQVNYSSGGPQGLYPRLNAIENMLFFSGIKGAPLSENECESILDRVGLKRAAFHHQCYQYSLGMRQRMHLAKLLINPCEFVLADEPTNGLDKDGIRLAEDIFNTDLGHKTKIVISHDDSFLRAISSRLFDLNSRSFEELG